MRLLLCLLSLLLVSACGVKGPLRLPDDAAAVQAESKKQARKTRPAPPQQTEEQKEMQYPPYLINEQGEYEIRGNITQ